MQRCERVTLAAVFSVSSVPIGAFGRFIPWQRVPQYKCSAGEHFLDDDAPAKQFTRRASPGYVTPLGARNCPNPGTDHRRSDGNDHATLTGAHPPEENPRCSAKPVMPRHGTAGILHAQKPARNR